MSLQVPQINLTTVMVGGAICVAVCILMLLIFKFSIREKSFEEVIEEQNKRSIQEQLQEKIKKEKEKKPKHKKWGKRKEKLDQLASSVKEVDFPPVSSLESLSETGDEIEIIEPKEITVNVAKDVTKKKTKSLQKNSVGTSTHLPAKTTEVEAPKVVPADTNQTKKVEKKEKSPNATTKAESTSTTKDKEKPNMDVIQPQISKVPASEEKGPEATVPVPSAVSNVKKKKKVEQSDKGEANYVSASKLMSLIKETALGDEESQMLIDMLLNKQKDASGWKKVNDSQAIAVKKQLQEKDMLLEQEHRSNQAAAQKLKQELNQEKTKATAVEKALQEKIGILQQEVHAMTARAKQYRDSLTTEKAAAQEKVQQVEKSAAENLESLTKKYQDEKAQLTKTIKKLESEARSNTTVEELETLKKSREDLQKVHTLLVEQHTLLITSHKTEVKNMKAELTDLRNKVQKFTEKNSNLLKEVESLKQKNNTLEKAKTNLETNQAEDLSEEVKCLQKQLEEAAKRCQDMDAQMKTLAEKNTEMAKQINEMASEIENLQVENEYLSKELAATNERVAGDGQEMLQQNGEINDKQSELEKFAGEQEKMLKEKELVLRQLYDDVSTYKGQIETLSNEVELQKQKNNELREKNWKAVDALKAAEKVSEDKLRDAEERIRSTQVEADKKLKQVQGSAVVQVPPELSNKLSQYEKEVSDLRQESGSRLQQYELQLDKNAQVNSEFQQLQVAHSSLEKRLSESQHEVEDLKSQVQRIQGNCRSCLQRLFPKVTIDSSLPHEEWLVQFERQALEVVRVASSSREDVEKLLAQLSTAENEKNDLKSKNAHYETVLAETEGMLNQLQESAKSKDLLWEEKSRVKQTELQNVMNEIQTLKAEKERLNSAAVELERIGEGKLKALQEKLQATENEKISCQQKYDEINKNYINLRDQVDSKTKALEDLQKEVASFDRVKKELDDVKSNLEKEKKINKDFSAQMVKLNSLVKIGEAALKAEQENVKKLQNQLDVMKASPANGTSSATAIEVAEDGTVKK